MIREIVKIDEEKCNGCGLCIPACHEGALQIIDNKAVLISDLMCDGLGACLGHCPEGALTVEKREAEPYNEEKVMLEMISKGKNVVIAHLKHLKDHDEKIFLKQGIDVLWKQKESLNFNPAEVVEAVYGLAPVSKEFDAPLVKASANAHFASGCPGSRTLDIQRENNVTNKVEDDQPSALSQWPVQLHLINPAAGYFTGCDLLIAADCVAFAMGNFHSKYLNNKKLVIACPKLDSGHEIYIEKIRKLIDVARVNTITIMRMEVPCCGGLLQMVKMAKQTTSVNVPVKEIVISISGEAILEQWI